MLGEYHFEAHGGGKAFSMNGPLPNAAVREVFCEITFSAALPEPVRSSGEQCS